MKSMNNLIGQTLNSAEKELKTEHSENTKPNTCETDVSGSSSTKL
jgi:hypothetical protein